MLINTSENIEAIQKIAKALIPLGKEIVFVGGAVVSLYINDTAAEDVRSTKDIDITIEIVSYSELEIIQENLRKLGFKQSAEDDVICRFRFEDIKVDVLSTKAVGWAPSNSWFEAGFKNAITLDLDDVTIKILPLGYFMATKLEAFCNRGIDDPLLSHDLEDIVYLLNYTTNIDEQINNGNEKVKHFIGSKLKEMINADLVREAMIASLYFHEAEERFEIIKERIGKINSKIS